jgi:hypothetical protein
MWRFPQRPCLHRASPWLDLSRSSCCPRCDPNAVVPASPHGKHSALRHSGRAAGRCCLAAGLRGGTFPNPMLTSLVPLHAGRQASGDVLRATLRGSGALLPGCGPSAPGHQELLPQEVVDFLLPPQAPGTELAAQVGSRPLAHPLQPQRARPWGTWRCQVPCASNQVPPSACPVPTTCRLCSGATTAAWCLSASCRMEPLPSRWTSAALWRCGRTGRMGAAVRH